MSGPPRRRSLASLVHEEAPLPVRRAAAILVPVAAVLHPQVSAGEQHDDVTAARVLLGDDGSVLIEAGVDVDAGGGVAGVGAGACLGRLLFELLVGRPPLSIDDVVQPHLQSVLAPSTISLLVRSCASSPGQWPTVEQWRTELSALAGGLAPPPPPAQEGARRRRRLLLTLALAALVAISLAVVLAAPAWWDAATSDDGALGGSAPQAVERS